MASVTSSAQAAMGPPASKRQTVAAKGKIGRIARLIAKPIVRSCFRPCYFVGRHEATLERRSKWAPKPWINTCANLHVTVRPFAMSRRPSRKCCVCVLVKDNSARSGAASVDIGHPSVLTDPVQVRRLGLGRPKGNPVRTAVVHGRPIPELPPQL